MATKRKIELKKFLVEELGIPQANVDAAATNLTTEQLEAAAEKLAGGYMRQDEFDRNFNEMKSKLQQEADEKLSAERRKLDAANAKINKEMAEWAQLQTQGKEATAKMQRDLEALQVERTKLVSRVSQLATEAGHDPQQILKEFSEAPAAPAPKQEPTVDTSKFVTAEDLDSLVSKRVGNIAQGIVDVPATFMRLGNEHQSLFGQPLDPDPIVAELKKRAQDPHNDKSLDPRDIWQEMHSVEDKRAEIAKQKHDEEIKAAEERGRQEARSEASIPGSTNAPGRHAAIFGDGERKSALERPQPLTTVSSAAAALRSGKYRTPQSGEAAKTA